MLLKLVNKLVTKCNFTENCNNLAKLIHSEDETCSGHCSKHQKDIHWSYIWHFKSTKFNDISLLYTCQRQKIGSLSSICRSVMLWKGLFRTLTNIIEWESCKNVELFSQSAPSYNIVKVLNTSLSFYQITQSQDLVDFENV